MSTRIAVAVAALVAVAAPAAAQTCKAFVNFAGPAKAGQPTYQVVDVDTGVKPSAAAPHGGLSVGWQGVRHDLKVEPHERKAKNQFGTIEEHWTVITSTAGGGGSTWLDTNPRCEPPEDDEMGISEFDCSDTASVEGIVGPYVSLSIPRGGYAGGAHGYDDSSWTTLRAPTGLPVHVGRVLVGDLGADAAKRAWEAAATDDGRESPPDVSIDGIASTGLTVDGGSLVLQGQLSCCTWVENHNLFELRAPLPKVPAPLADLAPRGGAWPGPSGCGSVAVRGKDLVVVRDGKDTKVAAVPAGAKLLGVSWLGDAPKVDDAAHKAATKQARELAAEKRWTDALASAAKAVAAKPGDPATLAEQGWLQFQAGDPTAALATSWEALSLASDKALQGAIFYNLGRVYEEKGDKSAARTFYSQSLQSRPGNATVQKRLDALQR